MKKKKVKEGVLLRTTSTWSGTKCTWNDRVKIKKPTAKEVCVFQRRLVAGLCANNAIHRWRSLLRSGVSICLPTLSKVWDTQMMFIILGNIISFIGRTAAPLTLALSQIAHIIVLVGICSPVHSTVMMSLASSLALRLFANTCRRINH